MVATGRHSVAPYGVCILVPGATLPTVFWIMRAGTGAPHENTCRRDGIEAPVVSQCSLSKCHTAGDANACDTFQSFAAAISFRGSADAGREKSISGNTVVTPI